ncbi:MAG TPA: S9 family peptidase [Terriglobales bacterium]|nr:S9 family peptidase [Terriglobales bacterium]
MGGLSTRRHFTFGLAAAAVPLASRLSFGQAKAVETAAHAAPIAPIVPKRFTAFGGVRIDNYDWLRDREDPRVVSYLNAENAYAEERLEQIKPLVKELAAELKAREAQEDATVPTAYNGYIYERRFSQGAQYPYVVRRKDEHGAQEEIVLNVGELAAGRQQYQLGSWNVSPDNTRVAFAVDFTGGREFRIFVRTIATGETVDQGIDSASSDLVFAADSNTLFYVRNEPTTVRSYQIWRHRLGSNPNGDALIYEESDPTFELSIGLSGSRKFILLNISEERTSEIRYLPVNRPMDEFKVIEPRQQGVVYEVDHVGDQFYIRTNLDAPDFRLMSAPQATPAALSWKEIVPEQPGHHLSHFKAFETFVAVDVEDESGTTIRVFNLPELREIPVPRPAAIGVASSSFVDDNEANLDPAAKVLRFHFSSPLQPQCVYDFDVTTGALTLRKQDQASRWFDPNFYVLDQLSATAPDGERVPITIVYRKDMRRPEGNPILIVGYGAYGLSLRATFTRSVFSLIDRGFVYGIAHVRGGHEKGERWYAEGRMLNKRNTFTDFIAVTETLIAKGYGDPRAIFAQGGSAGGLLMGAIANLRPDLYAGIVAEVPFVDVVTTMSDASVPLTTLEYDEWGNPAVKREYDYMLSYSPYENVAQKSYPAMFVTAGFYDSQVSYAEPAKWVAKLRASNIDTHDLLFKTDMAAGHSGRSGRLGSIEQDAEMAAWLIAHAGRR